MKHTIGPWIRTGSTMWPHNKVVSLALGVESELVIADCIHDHDASLIAAAPDLFEALQLMLHQCLHPNFDNENKWRLVIEVAEAALAKAEGK